MHKKGFDKSRKYERFTEQGKEGLGLSCKLCELDNVTIRDLSIGGAGVCLNEPVEVGATCELGIHTSNGQYRLTGTVIWVREEMERCCKYMAGLRFERSSIESSKDLVYTILNEE